MTDTNINVGKLMHTGSCPQLQPQIMIKATEKLLVFDMKVFLSVTHRKSAHYGKPINFK